MKYGLEITHLTTNKEYTKDLTELTQPQLELLEDLVEKAVAGKLTYLMIEINGDKTYFPAEVLKESVIKIFKETT